MCRTSVRHAGGLPERDSRICSERREKERRRRSHMFMVALARPRNTRSGQGRTADALASGGEEGRDKLRKAAGRRKWPEIRGCPNGATRHAEGMAPAGEAGANPGNRNIQVPGGRENNSDTASSGERKRRSPNRRRRGAAGVEGPAQMEARRTGTVWKGGPQRVRAPYGQARASQPGP